MHVEVRGELGELGLSFHLYVCSGDEAQSIRLGNKCLFLMNHLASPLVLHFGI